MYKRLHLLVSYLHGSWQTHRGKLVDWFWLLLGYFVSQVAIQAMNFLGGIIIIRSLSKDDYASYTIVNTMGPVMNMLSDNGITLGLFAVGRKIWQDNEKMGSLVRTGLSLRQLFGWGGLVITAPIMAWMLDRNHASWTTIALLIAVVLGGIWCQLTSGVIKVVVELRQQIAVLRNIGLASAALRFGLIIIFVSLLPINAWIATLAATCAAALETWLLLKSVRSQIHWQATENDEFRATIFSMVKKTAPLTIYFCLQSQISIWLISIFGKAHQVADIGALSRLGMIFTILASVYGTIAVPRFSRTKGRRQVFLRLWQIIGSYVFILAILTVLAKVFPMPLLFILGPQYINVADLVWLVILSAGLGSLGGLVWGLSTCRGWVVSALISIPLEILTQVLLLLSLDLSKSQNVLIFSSLSVLPPMLLTISFIIRSIRHEEEEILSN